MKHRPHCQIAIYSATVRCSKCLCVHVELLNWPFPPCLAYNNSIDSLFMTLPLCCTNQPHFRNMTNHLFLTLPMCLPCWLDNYITVYSSLLTGSLPLSLCSSVRTQIHYSIVYSLLFHCAILNVFLLMHSFCISVWHVWYTRIVSSFVSFYGCNGNRASCWLMTV